MFELRVCAWSVASGVLLQAAIPWDASMNIDTEKYKYLSQIESGCQASVCVYEILDGVVTRGWGPTAWNNREQWDWCSYRPLYCREKL